LGVWAGRKAAQSKAVLRQVKIRKVTKAPLDGPMFLIVSRPNKTKRRGFRRPNISSLAPAFCVAAGLRIVRKIG